MSDKSRKSKIVAVRLPNEVIDMLKKRILNSRYTGLSDYLRARITYDTMRKHGKCNTPLSMVEIEGSKYARVTGTKPIGGNTLESNPRASEG